MLKYRLMRVKKAMDQGDPPRDCSACFEPAPEKRLLGAPAVSGFSPPACWFAACRTDAECR